MFIYTYLPVPQQVHLAPLLSVPVKRSGEEIATWTKIFVFYDLFNRPRVAGAALQTPSSFIHKPATQAAGAQTLPDATPPIGKIHPFSKIAKTFEQIMRLKCPSKF